MQSDFETNSLLGNEELRKKVQELGFEKVSAPRHYDTDGSRMRDMDAFVRNCVKGDPTETGDFKGFKVHGVYTVSNAISFEIELSPDAEAARARRTLYDGVKEITDWKEIDVEVTEDPNPSIVDACGRFEQRPIIRDVFGFDVYLDNVMVVRGDGDER